MTLSADKKNDSLQRNWLTGVLVVVTNPKTALMWIAMATFLFAGGGTWVHVLLFGPLGSLSALAVYGLYAWLFFTHIATRSYQRFSVCLNIHSPACLACSVVNCCGTA